MYHLPFDVEETSLDDAVSALHEALGLGIKPLLETVQDMLAVCGDPDLCYDCVQVAGTNGKTSTARFAAAILAGEGKRVALYTSPHLVRYNERLEICGEPVAPADFAHGIAAAIEAGHRVNEARVARGEEPYDVTEFDLVTVASLVVCAEKGVDVVVLEVGMGGRWDATSASRSIRSVAVTGIGLDHTRILGDTLEAIAGEKAAIIKSGRTCALGVGTATPASVEDVFLARCRETGVSPVLVRADDPAECAGEMHAGEVREHADLAHASFAVTRHPERIGGSLVLDVTTPAATYVGVSALKPAFQAANIALAVTLCEQYLGRALDAARLFDSVVCCPTPGRFDVVRPDPVGLVDACHNPQSVETFLTAVSAVEPDVSRRPTLVAAVLADKDYHGICALLARAFPRVVVTQTQSGRALPAAELAEAFREAGANVVGTYPTVGEALGSVASEPFVACGSITLAGEVAGAFHG